MLHRPGTKSKQYLIFYIFHFKSAQYLIFKLYKQLDINKQRRRNKVHYGYGNRIPEYMTSLKFNSVPIDTFALRVLNTIHH